MPFNPAATHSHHPRYPSLAPVRGHCGLSDALAQPQEGHAQANAAGVRPSPVAAADGVAGFGSGLPSIPASRPLLSRRRRTVTPKVSPPGVAFKSALLCVAIPEAGLSPQSSPGGQGPLDPPTADRRHPVTTFPRAVFAPLTCLQSRPPARLFSSETARRAVRSAQACPHWGRASRSVEGLYESRQYNQQPDPSTPTQSRPPHPKNRTKPRRCTSSPSPPSRVHSALHRSRHRQSAVSRPLLCAPFTRKRASRIFRRQPNRGGGCRSKNVLTGTVSQSEGRPV